MIHGAKLTTCVAGRTPSRISRLITVSLTAVSPSRLVSETAQFRDTRVVPQHEMHSNSSLVQSCIPIDSESPQCFYLDKPLLTHLPSRLQCVPHCVDAAPLDCALHTVRCEPLRPSAGLVDAWANLADYLLRSH